MDISQIIYVLRGIGIRGITQTILNSVSRDVIEKRFSNKSSNINPQIPGDIRQVTPISSGACIEFTQATLEIIFLSQNLIRISWGPGKPPLPYTINKFDWEQQHPFIETNNNGCIMRCVKMNLIVSQMGEISFLDSQHFILHNDKPPVRYGDGWQLTTILKKEDHIYGFGERASSLNLRPGNYCSWNTDVKGNYSTGTDPLYIGTPIYLSLSNSGSHLVYFENSFKSKYCIGDNLVASFEGGMLRYYLVFGSLDTIYHQLSDLIGRPCLPPRWSLGYHQSRWGYRSEADIRDLVKGFEENKFPLSAVHLDIDYMDGYRVFTINSKRFPDMTRLTNDLDKKGIKVVVSINPAVKKDRKYMVFNDGKVKDFFCKLPNGKLLGGVSWSGWSVFPDFSNREARKWWSEQYQYLVNLGISGFWHDMNEPSSFSAWGDMTLPSSTQHNLDGQGGDHRQVHNLYGLLMNMASFEGLRRNSDNKRPWIFSRAGWAGLQKYAWNWTGDIDSSWQALKQTITTILGLGLSGHAFSGGDIGGFSGSPDPELYLRWFQMSTFLPLFRTHSAIGTNPREPWVFEEPITSILRNFLELRYRLLPYLYTLAWDTNQTGFPPIRPLFWENPADPTLWDIDDEFLLGDALLIAPVVSKGAQSRRITIPPGTWYSFWDDRQYNGPSQFEIEVSHDTIPIFVKGGTILPLEQGDGISLHVYPYPGHSSSNHIYSDDGDGYGSWRVDNYYSSYQSKSLSITWETDGGYPFQYSIVRFFLHSKSLLHASADGLNIPIQENTISTPVFHNLSLSIK
jgi:alpha-glucosidase